MFETLKPAPGDKILALIAAYREDTRPDKIDLGVGVYRDDKGATPVLRAVKEAEKRLWIEQDSKAYLGLLGDVGFNEAMVGLLFGATTVTERVRAVQAPGGSGALRILGELIARANKDATVWLSDPTWPNHGPVMINAGLKTKTYPYFDAASASVRFDAMVEALKQAGPGDVVLLHGCCHNPTGANLTIDQWQVLADLAVERGFLPFIDIAYQGFGDGLEEDAAGLRLMAGRVPEMLVAASCSKNFGLYRDRVGCAMLMGASAEQANASLSQLTSVTRGSYSMPPDHGAAAVRMILTDPALKAAWCKELDEMRNRMLSLRQGLADALRRGSNSDKYDFVAEHRGMFSLMGTTSDQVRRLREEFGIYMVDDGRINIAGLPEDRVEYFAKALLKVCGD
ncbi:amino acid aminotransferase [Aestuariispira ectoiniformans]|uniref:amino acid aminotransferase n=1 Tax=Aestuariispira ectoiniformans TaxID=2775080 RepID=UPI00223A90EB|nr:amino acid aminotransferase [Aestuariispira ectoiniformans]